MDKIEREMKAILKLVEGAGSASYGGDPQGKRLTKKRVRRIADPHIRKHKVKGKEYYYFCRGIDKEIYLGDAERLLRDHFIAQEINDSRKSS
jgi:hypothetical protein